MGFGKNSTKYIIKNFFKLLVFTIVPSIALAFTGSVSTILTFFFNYKTKTNTVWNIYRNFTFIGSRNWLLGVLAIILISFFLSLLLGAIDRHMKIGKFSFARPFSNLNETVLVVTPVVVVFILLLELVAFVNSSFVFLFAKMPTVPSVILSILITLVFYSAVFIVFAQFMLLIPSQTVAGYPILDACIYSTRMISGKCRIVYLDFLALALIAIGVSTLFVGLLPELKILQFVIDTILYNILLMYLIVYPMVAYFELSSEPRRDLENQRKKYLT